MEIPLDVLDFLPPALRVRSAPPSDAAVGMLAASMRERGQLQPIVVAPLTEGRRLVIIGETRARAAASLGWNFIRAEEQPVGGDADIVAAQAAENLARTAMTPVEKWRAMTHLLELQFTLPAAAAIVGVSERGARKLQRLGALHPDILVAIERGDQPDEDELRLIAGASLERQAEALANPASRSDFGPDKGCIDWTELADLLRVARIPLSRAIFDVENSGLVFEEDLFAPADASEAYTDDVKLFLELQRRALEARVLCPPKGVRYEITTLDRYGYPKTPAGAEQEYDADPMAPKRGRLVLWSLYEGDDQERAGEVVGRVFKVPAAKGKAAEAKAPPTGKPGKPAPTGAPEPIDDAETDAEDSVAEPEDAEADAPEPAPATEPTGITKPGLEIIAQAKTTALRRQLGQMAAHSLTDRQVIICLLLLLTAPNVRIHGFDAPENTDQPWNSARDYLRGVRARLVNAGGAALAHGLDDADLRALAGDVLARCLSAAGPRDRDRGGGETSAEVAEWIGHALRADDRLPPFDTAEFLACCNGDLLREAAAIAGLKPAKKVTALREQLEGHAPTWLPAAAQFGAPGPRGT